MKKYLHIITLLIPLLFVSCNKSIDLNDQTKLLESIDNYYTKYNDTLLSDSLRLYYTQKGLKQTKRIETDTLRLRYYYKGNDKDIIYETIVSKVALIDISSVGGGLKWLSGGPGSSACSVTPSDLSLGTPTCSVTCNSGYYACCDDRVGECRCVAE